MRGKKNGAPGPIPPDKTNLRVYAVEGVVAYKNRRHGELFDHSDETVLAFDGREAIAKFMAAQREKYAEQGDEIASITIHSVERKASLSARDPAPLAADTF